MEKKTQRNFWIIRQKFKKCSNRNYSTPILFKGNNEQKKICLKS